MKTDIELKPIRTMKDLPDDLEDFLEYLRLMVFQKVITEKYYTFLVKRYYSN